MIIKKSLMKAKIKSSYNKLINYLSNEKNSNENIRNAGLWFSTQEYEVEDLDLYVKDIEATQKRNTSSNDDKTYHLIVSFPQSERPSSDILKSIEKDIAKALNYENHQRICIVHDDTDNFHFHIAINKINPSTFKINTPYNDYNTLSNVAIEIEKKYKLTQTNHIKTEIPYNKNKDMEHSGFLENLETYIKKIDFEKINTWAEFHNKLNEASLIYMKKGAGAVFGTSDNKIFIKASTVDAGFSLGNLEKRLGEFQKSDCKNENIKSKYQKIALQNSELFKKYTDFNNKRKIAINNDRNSLFEEYAKKNNDEISTIKNVMEFALLAEAGYLEKIIIRKFFNAQMKEKKEQLFDDKKDRLKNIYKNNAYKPFSNWLREEAKTNVDAENYLLKEQSKQNYILGDFQKHAPKALAVTKNGTYILNKDIRFTPSALKITTHSKILNNLIFYNEHTNAPLKMVGTEIFKNKVINTIVDNEISISLDDKEMQNKLTNLKQIKDEAKNELITDFNKLHNDKMYKYRAFENQENSYLYQGFIKYSEQYFILLKSETQNLFYVKQPVSADYAIIKNNNLKKGNTISFTSNKFSNNIIIDSFLEKKEKESFKYVPIPLEKNIKNAIFYGERRFKGKTIHLYKENNIIYSKIVTPNKLIQENQKKQSNTM